MHAFSKYLFSFLTIIVMHMRVWHILSVLGCCNNIRKRILEPSTSDAGDENSWLPIDRRRRLRLSGTTKEFDVKKCILCQKHLIRDFIYCRNTPDAQGIAVYSRYGQPIYRQKNLECRCQEVLCFKIYSNFYNVYIFALYRNPGHHDSIYDCLLEGIASAQ